MCDYFSVFDREEITEGTVIYNPDFSVTYRHSDGSLLGDDREVLLDIRTLIRSNYGTFMKKDQVFDRIKRKKLPKGKVLRAGVCFYDNNPTSGWNGALNAYWADDRAPGEVVNIYYTWTLSDSAFDFQNLSDQEIIDSPDRDAIIRTMIMFKSTHPRERDAVDSRIKGIIRASA